MFEIDGKKMMMKKIDDIFMDKLEEEYQVFKTQVDRDPYFKTDVVLEDKNMIFNVSFDHQCFKA